MNTLTSIENTKGDITAEDLRLAEMEALAERIIGLSSDVDVFVRGLGGVATKDGCPFAEKQYVNPYEGLHTLQVYGEHRAGGGSDGAGARIVSKAHSNTDKYDYYNVSCVNLPTEEHLSGLLARNPRAKWRDTVFKFVEDNAFTGRVSTYYPLNAETIKMDTSQGYGEKTERFVAVMREVFGSVEETPLVSKPLFVTTFGEKKRK